MSASSSSCSQVGVHGHAESETEVKATSSSHTLSHTSPSSSSPTTSTCYDVSVADMMRPIGLPTPQEHLRCVLMAIAMAARGVAEHVLRQLPTRGCGGGNDAIRTSSGKDGRLSTTRHLFASDGPRLPAPRACHSPTRAGTDEAGANTTTSTAVGGATNTSSSTSGGKVLAEEEEKGEEEMREVGGVFVSKASLPSPAVATIGTTTAVKEQTNHVLPFHRDSLQGYLSYQVRTAAGVRSPTRTCCEEGRRGARSPQQRRTLSTPTNMMAMQVELEEGVCATSAGVDSSSSSKHSRSTLGGTNPQSTTTTNASPESLLSSGEENARPMAKNELFHHHNHPEVEEEAPPPMLGGGTERSRSSTSDTIGPDDPREPTVVFDASKVLPLRDGNGCVDDDDDDDGYDDVDEVEVDVDGHEDDDEEEMLDGSTGNASMRANFSENTRLSRTSVNAHRRMTIAQLLHLLEDRRSRQWQLTRELYGAEGGGNGLGEVGASSAGAGASGAGGGGSSGGSAGMSSTKESGEVSAVRHPRNGATGYGLVHSDVTAEVLQQRREASRAQRRQQKEAQHAMTQGSGPSREDVPDFPRLLESRRSAAARLAPQTSSKEHTQWTSTKVRQRRADGGGGGGLRSANTSTTSSARATTTSAAAGALMHQGQSDVSLTSSASQPARPHPSHDRRVDDLTVKHHQEGGRGSQPTYSISLIYHSSTGSTRTIDTSALPPLKGEVSGGSFRRSATGTGGAGASTTSNVYGSGRLRTATTSSAGTSARNTGTIITAGANYAMGVSPPASLHARSLSKTSTNASADERRGVSPSPAAVSGGGGGVEQHTTSRRSLPPSPALHAQQHTASGVAPLCPELLPCTSSQLVDGSPTPTAHGTTPAEGLQPAKRVREEVDGAAAEDGTMPSMSRTPPNANSRGRTGTSQRRLASTATNNVGASCASPAAAVAAPRPLFGAPLPPTEPIHGPRLEGVAGRNGEKIIGAFLGGGACGKVYECLNIETGQVLAAKQIVFDPKEPKLRQRLKQLELEMEVLTLATKHQVRWIVGFFGAERRGHAVLMYLEYCEHGSLLDYMANVQHAAGGGGGGNATAMTGDADQRQSCSGYVAGATSFPLGSNSSSDSAGRFSGLPATFSISAGAAASGTSVDGNGAMCEVSVTDDVPGVPRTVPSLELEAVQRFTYQILCGLDFLHRHNYAHLDVKTANVLLTADEACRLADFGCSMRLQQPPATTTRRDDEEAARGGGEMEGEAAAAAQASGEQHAAPYPVLVDRAGITELRGTALYMAPEMIRFERHRIGTPADVWSLGCVVMEMATGCAPWRHIASDKLRVLFRIGAARHDPILPPLLKQRALEARQWLVEHGFLIIDDDDDGTTMHMLAEEEVDEEVLDGDDDVQRTRRVMEGWLHLESFVQACVHLNPEDRASTEELLQHPFVLPVAAMEMVGEEVEE